MKFLALIFLFGLAAANFHDVLDENRDDAVRSFMEGMSKGRSLREALDMPFAEELDETEDEIKTELGKKLKEHLDDILQQIRDAMDHGGKVKEELWNRLKEVRAKLKDLHIDIGNKARELLKTIKEKFQEWLKEQLKKIGIGKRALNSAVTDLELESLANELHLSGIEMRSLKELWEKLKKYVKDLKLDFKEKYMKFYEWLKENVKTGLDSAKDKIDNLKVIAREFIDHHKGISKEVAMEALEFLRPYKEDLGDLWKKMKESVKEILGRE